MYLELSLVGFRLLDRPLFLYFLLLIWAQSTIVCALCHASDVGLGHNAVLNDRVANPNRLLLEGNLMACIHACIACHSWSVLSSSLIIMEGLLYRLAGWRFYFRLLIHLPSVELLG